MNWLDLIIVIIIAGSSLYGYKKGFLRKVLGIAGLIAGIVLALKFNDSVSSLFAKLFETGPAFSKLSAFLFILLVVYGLAVWVARFMANFNKGTSVFDKVTGTILGFGEGILLSSILLFNLTYAGYLEQKVISTSFLYPLVLPVAPKVIDIVLEQAPELKNIYHQYKDSLKVHE